jgi:hypothetical protein
VAVVILHVHTYEKRVARKFKSGGLHVKHVIATWKPSQHSLVDTGKPRKTCVEVAGRRILVINSILVELLFQSAHFLSSLCPVLL